MGEDAWKYLTGWCPACWWKAENVQFHISATAEGIEQAFVRAHNKRSPECQQKRPKIEAARLQKTLK